MEREIWIDWMRVTACFMVMMVHSTEPFYLADGGGLLLTEADAWWVSLSEAIVRMCVPMFIIASSYLQFPLHYPTGEFFRRRAKRILIPLAFWSLVYALYWGDPISNLRDLLLNFNYAAGHLWFVYMLVGVYLLMPMLSPWAEKVGRRELLGYIALCIFTGFIPLIRDWVSGGDLVLNYGPTGIPNRALYPLWGECSWNAYGVFYYFSGFIGYLLMGLYLRRFSPIQSWRKTLAVAMPCLLMGAGISFVGFLRRVYETSGGQFPLKTDLAHAVWFETTLCNDTISVILMTVGWVLLMRKAFNTELSAQRSSFLIFNSSFLIQISKASYGMYLCHMLVLSLVSAWLRDTLGIGTDGCLGIWTTPLQIILTATITFPIVAIIAILVQRIPKVGKYIMG